MADDFYGSDHDEDLSFASPQTPVPGRAKNPAGSEGRFDTDEAREAALRKELEGIRKINEVIEGFIGTLERAKGNMNTVHKTVDNASTLLNTWTRILSQTEHNQRLILNPSWKGATQDLVEMEAEALQKQQEAERKAAEAERRREEARARAEEEERRRAAGTAGAGSSARGSGLGRGVTRGRVRGVSSRVGGATTGSSALHSADTTSSSTASSRNASGIGRGGFGYGRGARGRGVR
ncbi:hypothetical protein VTJ83DRAFT_5443 [Remersonia thermophila]|uniref:DASH complex subunit DUO1 n=1 Tax=Remersonia thermophila TaxID=72144 RepID=A0ABR4D8B4_9PEZI